MTDAAERSGPDDLRPDPMHPVGLSIGCLGRLTVLREGRAVDARWPHAAAGAGPSADPRRPDHPGRPAHRRGVRRRPGARGTQHAARATSPISASSGRRPHRRRRAGLRAARRARRDRPHTVRCAGRARTAAARHRPRDGRAVLRRALDLRGGPPFADLHDAASLQPDIIRLSELHMSAVEDRAATHWPRSAVPAPTSPITWASTRPPT